MRVGTCAPALALLMLVTTSACIPAAPQADRVPATAAPPPSATAPVPEVSQPAPSTPTAVPPPASTAPAPLEQTPTRASATQASPATPVPANPIPRESLVEAVQAAVARHTGTIGVVVKSLNSGETVSTNADQRFTSASLYKLLILDAAESAIEDGSLDPAEVLTLTRAVAAADPYSDLQVGTRISVDCALQTMIEMSGNSAADLLLRRVGTAAVNARVKADGLTRSAITADGAYTSPTDMATLLDSVGRGHLINSAASQRMLDLLLAQQHNDRLPAPLPLNVRVAHKTGELPDLRHDAGIVFAPTGAYVIVAMVEDAPTESEARAAIVDVSQAAYTALTPTDPSAAATTSAGLPPRLAQQVFRVPDAQGRLELLGDPRTETAELPSAVATSVDADADLRLRSELFDDLLALQRAAERAGTPFWVRSGFEQPTDADARFAVPTEWLLPCALEQPGRVADRRVPAAEAANASARQVWLGTVLSVTDREAGPPSATVDRSTPAWQWLEQHAADFGFAPALLDSGDASSTGHQPWTLRWVGHDMAMRLRPFDTSDYGQRARTELVRAETDLASQRPESTKLPAYGLADGCWTVATTSTRGCPSRWYFLGLPLS